jgi:ABC-type phosphonate transport system ATPase subunit
MDAGQSRPVTNEPLVRFEGVTKRFDDVVAVDDVTLDVAEGECFALLGGSAWQDGLCGSSPDQRPTAGRCNRRVDITCVTRPCPVT